MNALYLCAAEVACFANDNDAFIPEKWAMEGLMQLEENMVIANMIHRDFENEVARHGDVVNTRKPGEFEIDRKVDGDTLVYQDAVAANVQVKLDQWFTIPFVIYDGEESLSFKDLVAQYLRPAMRVIARGVDRAVLGRFHSFLGTPTDRVGRLENLASATSHEVVLDAREVLNVNLAPLDAQRHLMLSPRSETALLKNDMFLKSNERGDGGEALENARLGKILGFNTWMGQNVANKIGGDTLAGTVTGAEAAGTTGSITISIAGYAAVVGEFCNFAGNDQPTHVTASSGTGATTAVTLNEALKYATGAGAVVTLYKKDTTTAAYDVNYSKKINLTNALVTVGQLLAFGTGATRRLYTIIEKSGNDVILDRPLEVAVGNGDDAFPGPAGSYNLAFHREALALVTRPLVLPRQGTGSMSGVAAYNDVAMRINMQYDQSVGGTRVNCDLLAGVAVLDQDLAVVVLG
jgi:hypothetical protein